MTLIKSISGIRGTIGGSYNDNLTPQDVVECTAAYGTWILQQKSVNDKHKVVVGRDGRISGQIVLELAVNTLLSLGIDVIDLDLSTTPTVEVMVTHLNADGGIIFTASHNPIQWNALKFLNSSGEFISAEVGKLILQLIAEKNIVYAEVLSLGKREIFNGSFQIHNDKILALPYVDIEAVKSAKLKVIVDCINSTGTISIPPLLDRLGVEYHLINAELTGHFAHNPEPLAEHLIQLSKAVVDKKAHLGISIDPDVDRLAFVCEDGSMFGEEYTLVAVADYILSIKGGNTVSNLSSTRALSDVTLKHGYQYNASAVGEVNVVNMMKASQAVIGGEGNGGIILPELHYGRDALVGIAIFLTHFAKQNLSMTRLKASYPSYIMIKDKVDAQSIDIQVAFAKLKIAFADQRLNDVDGLKIDFANGWVHLRTSNTEPIVRIYCEAKTEKEALELIQNVKNLLK
jgi:phosphomannomutase